MDKRGVARALVLLVVASVVAGAAPAARSAPLGGNNFRTPSDNIHCFLGAGSLRCDIMSGLNPEPERDCEVDWAGLSVTIRKGAGPTCAGDTVYNNESPVLEYGQKWTGKRIVCISRKTGLRCVNRKSHGFFLSRDSWRTF